MNTNTNKNNQPRVSINVSPVRMDSTLAKRKPKVSFDMALSDIRAKEAFKRGGTSIE